VESLICTKQGSAPALSSADTIASAFIKQANCSNVESENPNLSISSRHFNSGIMLRGNLVLSSTSDNFTSPKNAIWFADSARKYVFASSSDKGCLMAAVSESSNDESRYATLLLCSSLLLCFLTLIRSEVMWLPDYQIPLEKPRTRAHCCDHKRAIHLGCDQMYMQFNYDFNDMGR
jgi:hypothetical protein